MESPRDRPTPPGRPVNGGVIAGSCEVPVPVSRNGFGSYATSLAILLGLPFGLDKAPNSLLLS
jgi:hypothetical protein